MVKEENMKKALISPTEQVQYISAWNETQKPAQPVYTVIPRAQRIAEVADQAFLVAPPLYWGSCNDNVLADQWYWDPEKLTAVEVPAPPPYPIPTDQPQASGVQTI